MDEDEVVVGGGDAGALAGAFGDESAAADAQGGDGVNGAAGVDGLTGEEGGAGGVVMIPDAASFDGGAAGA